MDLSRKTYFFTDLHADPKALSDSLRCCEDPNALYLFGGDCLDKGPSNLRLLDELRKLSERVEVKILAGNHDLRMLMVLQNWRDREDKDSKFAKVFTPKRFEKRITPFLNECGGIQRAKEMFLKPGGQYSWFYDEMEFYHRDGEFLFLHAGVGDEFAKELRLIEAGEVKSPFPSLMRLRNTIRFSDELYKFYYGALGASMRTKYRTKDWEFTEEGADTIRDIGINYVVHGHDNKLGGHEMKDHHGITHFVCDCTVDSDTRRKAGLAGDGFAVATFCPESRTASFHSSDGNSFVNLGLMEDIRNVRNVGAV